MLFFGTRSSLAWFGSGSCPMPGGFVSGQKCLAVDANGVEVPWRGEIILPKGTASITDHAFYTGGHAIAGTYQLQLVEDNGSCCTVYQTIDYTVSSTGVTTPASFAVNQAALTEAFTHHAVGTGGLLGYFLYVSNPTTIPAGSDCQNVVSFLDANGASLGTGTSGTGEKCNTPSPVPGGTPTPTPTPTPPPATGTLSAHIFDCTDSIGTVDIAGGHVMVTKNGTTVVPEQANPLVGKTLEAGEYSVGAVAPPTFHLADCNNVTSASPKTVTVPASGTKDVVFYVKHDVTPPPARGTISAHIYDCTDSVGATDVTGGQVMVTRGGTTVVPSQANPLLPKTVSPGEYSVGAVAPADFHLADCNGVTNSTPKTVTVPANGTENVVFYVKHNVTPPPATGTLSAHIYDCTGNVVGSVDVTGGHVMATSNGKTVVPSQANPLLPKTVSPGEYSVGAVAPANFHLADCNGVTSASPKTVTVPANGTENVVFYVKHDTGTLAGHIYDCETTATTTEVLGGNLAATGVSTGPNPMKRTTVIGGVSYPVVATAPSGYQVVACGANKTNGTTKNVFVPNNGHGVAVFYVRKIVVTPPGGGTGGTTNPPGGGTGGTTNPPAGGTQGVSTSNNPVAQVVAAVTGQGVKGAATTQPNTGRVEMLRNAIVSLVLLVSGAVMLVNSRRKEARA